MNLLRGSRHFEAEHEHQVGDDDEATDYEEDEALEDFVPGDFIVEEILGVRLEQRMMAGAILQPDWGGGQQGAADISVLFLALFSSLFLHGNYCSLNQPRRAMFAITPLLQLQRYSDSWEGIGTDAAF